jgi:uncharacterized membrane protein YqjE
MSKFLPMLALGLGLASYSLLLLVSQEAAQRFLVIFGLLSVCIIIMSLGIIWDIFRLSNRHVSQSNAKQGEVQVKQNDAYLEIENDD